MLNFDISETTRQRNSFMKNPPPCSSIVIYRPPTDNENGTNAFFYFNSAAVEFKAREMHHDYEDLSGINAAVLWTSRRNDLVLEPTDVPDLLINFDCIAEELIQAEHGQVKCFSCEKIYTVSELERNMIGFPMSARSGWIYADFICPEKHSLLLREVMHIIRRMADK